MVTSPASSSSGHRARRPARRLQHVGDDVAVRQLHALADAGRPAGVGEVGEVGGRVDVGVQVPVGRVAGEQVGEVDVAVLELQPGGEVEGVRLAGDDRPSRTGVAASAPRTKGSTWSQVMSTRGAGVGELGGEVGGRQQRVGGGEGGPGQQDPVVERRVLPAVRDVHGDDVARGRCRGRPASRRRRAPARPSSVKVSGTSWSMNAGRSPQRRTAARRIDPTGTSGYSSDRGSPGRPAGGGGGGRPASRSCASSSSGRTEHTAWLRSHALSRCAAGL